MTKHFDVDYRDGKYYLFINGVSSNTTDCDMIDDELKRWIEGNHEEISKKVS